MSGNKAIIKFNLYYLVLVTELSLSGGAEGLDDYEAELNWSQVGLGNLFSV